MDRISGLPSNKIAKELQGYKRYTGKTQKEIKEKLGNVDSLRYELRRLESKAKTSKSNQELKSPKLVDDTLKEIMLRADVDTIKIYCLTNKNAEKLCHDPYFWNEKLKLENLPPLFIQNMPDVNLENYIGIYHIKNEWMILYSLMKTANKDAKKILIVNDMEANRKYDKTTGQISTDQSDDIIIDDFYVLPVKAIEKLKKLKDNHIVNIEIHYNGKYTLYLYTSNTDDSSENTTHYKISYHETLNILTLLLYNKYIDVNPDLILVDSNDTEFYYDTDFRGTTNAYLMAKQTIYETINYLEKNNMLK